MMVFVRALCAEGAPSLRSLQGRAAMLPTQPFVPSAETVAYALVVPALRKLRKGRGTHLVLVMPARPKAAPPALRRAPSSTTISERKPHGFHARESQQEESPYLTGHDKVRPPPVVTEVKRPTCVLSLFEHGSSGQKKQQHQQ